MQKIDCSVWIGANRVQILNAELVWKAGKPHVVIGANPDDTVITRPLNRERIARTEKADHFRYESELSY